MLRFQIGFGENNQNFGLKMQRDQKIEVILVQPAVVDIHQPDQIIGSAELFKGALSVRESHLGKALLIVFRIARRVQQGDSFRQDERTGFCNNAVQKSRKPDAICIVEFVGQCAHGLRGQRGAIAVDAVGRKRIMVGFDDVGGNRGGGFLVNREQVLNAGNGVDEAGLSGTEFAAEADHSLILEFPDLLNLGQPGTQVQELLVQFQLVVQRNL